MDKYHEQFPINEYFQSIQGEGNYAGINSLFIRFHYCNLSCTWCDTKYTWLGNHSKTMITGAEAIKKIISENTSHHIIFTGGEPALYRLDKLVIPNKKYHVETNGTIIPTEPIKLSFKSAEISRDAMDLEIIKQFNWVVSPKLSNARQEINEKSLAYWVNFDSCVFKFVIRNLSDLEEIVSICRKFGLDNNKIYISLEGQTLESQIKPQLVDEIIKYGFHFSPRLHVILWGNERMK